MEYYRNALRIRKELEDYLLRDFATKQRRRNIKQLISNIDYNDEKIISDICEKYELPSSRIFKTETPSWYVEQEQKYLMDLCRSMIRNIISANKIYLCATTPKTDYYRRRNYQQKALIDIQNIFEELYEMQNQFPTDLNILNKLLGMLDIEDNLIHRWISSEIKYGKT